MEHISKYNKCYVKKHITPQAICYNPPLVRNTPLGASAYCETCLLPLGNSAWGPTLAWWTGVQHSGTSVGGRNDLHIMLLANPSSSSSSGFELSYVLGPRKKWRPLEDRHDDVIKWNHFPRYWSFARAMHRSPVNSPQKGQWRGALMFSLICTWIYYTLSK